MSLAYKRTRTGDESNLSRTSLFTSLDNFKRRRTLDPKMTQPESTGVSSGQQKAVPLATRILNSLSGKLQSGSMLNPNHSSTSESRRSSISNVSTSFNARLSSLRNSLSRSPGPETSTLSQQGFSVVGTRTLGIRAHAPSQSPELLRLKFALLQDYRNRLAEKEKLLEDDFSKESEKIMAERKKKLEAESLESEERGPPPLTEDQRQTVHRYFAAARSRPRDVVVDAFRIELTFADLATLQPGKWLNDNVIDMFMNTVTASNPNVFVFTTHFFTRLEEDGYPAVRRWAMRKKLDVFVPDQVFVPVNRGNLHWTLAVVDNKNKRLAFYDSLPSGRGTNELNILLGYLKEEAKRMNKPSIPDYKLEPNASGPTQSNGSDCGVFVCETVSRLARGQLNLGHTQKDMPLVRERIASTLIELKSGSKL